MIWYNIGLLSQRRGEICFEEKSQETRRIHEELVAERLQELLATNHSQVSTVLHPQEMAAPSCTQVFATFTGWIWISWTLKRWEPKVPQWFLYIDSKRGSCINMHSS